VQNLQMVNNIMIKSLTSKISQVVEQTWKKKPKNSFASLNELWFSRNSQSLKVGAHLLTGSFTNRKKKCRILSKSNEKYRKQGGKNIIYACNGSLVSTLAILTNFYILTYETFPMWIYTELSKKNMKITSTYVLAPSGKVWLSLHRCSGNSHSSKNIL